MHKPFHRDRVVETTAEFDTLVPMPKVDHVLDADGSTIVLLEPRFRGWWLLERWLQPRLDARRAFVRVRLDSRGSYLWSQMEDGCDVAELIWRYHEAFREDAVDAGQRVRMFLVGMTRHGFIQLFARAERPMKSRPPT